MRRQIIIALTILLILTPMTIVVPSASTSTTLSNPSGVANNAVLVRPGTFGEIGTSGQVADANVVPRENTTSYLALPTQDIEHVRFGTANLDVGGAIAANRVKIQGSIDARWIDKKISAAENDTERRKALRTATNRLERRSLALTSLERASLNAYNNNTLTTAQYLRRLAFINTKAQAIQHATDRLVEYNEDFSNPPVSNTRIGQIYERTRPLKGPVREHISASLAGQEPPHRIYIETSNDGVTLSIVIDTPGQQEYLRETYLPSARNPQADDQFEEGSSGVLERLSNLYPWAIENQDGVAIGQSVGPASLVDIGIYSAQIFHAHGELTVLVDGGTKSPFYEAQRLDLTQIPTIRSVEKTSDNLRLRIYRARTGWPSLITVSDAETGQPANVTLQIDDKQIGNTGIDGRAWTIVPPGRYTVTATDNDRSVSVRLDRSFNIAAL